MWIVLKSSLILLAAVGLNLAPLAAAHAGENPQTHLRDTFIISGHRAGGRIYAPDNSLPNILFAIENELTAIEIDLRLTGDGKLILWHDASFPTMYVDATAAEGEKIATDRVSAAEVRRFRYSATVGGRTWEDVRVVFADDVVKLTKGKVNLHLDTKDVRPDRVIEFIGGHNLQAECMVMSGSIGYLETIHAALPEVCLEYTDNTLGRRRVGGAWEWYPAEKQHQLYHELMEALSAAGVDAFCTKGLTREKIAICHQYGIMVRTSANNLQVGQAPDRYLEMGVDYALTDDPVLMREALRKIRPDAAVSSPGQTFLELIRGEGSPRP
jgi:glycerophosphoryl diester phosphodiesterase